MNKFLFIIILLLIGQISFAHAFIQDDFVVKTLSDKNILPPKTNLEYNYQDTTKIKIPIKIKDTVKSEKVLEEGQILEFRTTSTVKKKGVIIVRKNQVVKAQVITLIKNGMNGIPASIVIGNFETAGLDTNKITSEYEIFGADLSLLVFPLKWALTFLPPTGSLTNFILGGHAKIKDNKTIDIYYYPNW